LELKEEGEVLVTDKDKEETGKEDAKAPRLEVGLKTALCMAAKVYDDRGKEGFDELKPTCDWAAQYRAEMKAYTRMAEVTGPMNGEDKSDVEAIVLELEETAKKLDEKEIQQPRSEIEEKLCLALDDMADAYFTQLYDTNTEDREDVCLTNACKRICEKTTSSMKKAFGGDCRFFCQCEAEAKKAEERLEACDKGKIFVNGECTAWSTNEKNPDEVHPQCADDDIEWSPQASNHQQVENGSAAPASVMTSTSLALLSLF